MTAPVFAAAQCSVLAGDLPGNLRRRLANHGGPTGGWPAAGRSAFRDEEGKVVAEVPGPGDRLLLVSTADGAWQGKTVCVDVDGEAAR